VSQNGRKTRKQNGSEEDLRYLPQQGTPVEAISTNKQTRNTRGGRSRGKEELCNQTKKEKKEKGNRIER
jgi:hypothetical protein